MTIRSQRPWKVASRWIRPVLAVLGGGFLVAKLVEMWNPAILSSLTWGSVALASVCVLLSVIAGSAVWAVAIGIREDRLTVMADYAISLPLRYIPGGAAQAIGQVGLALRGGRTAGEGLAGVALVTIGGVVGGLSVGLSVVVVTALGKMVVTAGMLVLVFLVFTFWPSIVSVLGRSRLGRRIRPLVPSRRSAVVIVALSTASLVATASGFYLLLGGARPSLLAIVAAFGAAWTVGVLAVPFPAGIGVREAMLVWVLPGVQPGLLLGASVALRLLSMIVELLSAAGFMLVARLSEEGGGDV